MAYEPDTTTISLRSVQLFNDKTTVVVGVTNQHYNYFWKLEFKDNKLTKSEISRVPNVFVEKQIPLDLLNLVLDSLKRYKEKL